MALLQDRTAAFVLRVWCETRHGCVPPLEWRGTIEHVPSGRRLCFRDMAAVAAFVQPYIDALLSDDPSSP